MLPAAQALQAGDGRNGYGRGLLKRQALWLQRQRRFRHSHILGISAKATQRQVAEHLVTGLELRHAAAHRFHTPGDLGADDFVFWLEQPIHKPHQKWVSAQQMPVTRRSRGGHNLYQDLIVLRDRLLHFFEPENIG